MKEVQGVALQNEAAKVFWNQTISQGCSRCFVSRSSIQGVQKFSVTGCQGGYAGGGSGMKMVATPNRGTLQK